MSVGPRRGRFVAIVDGEERHVDVAIAPDGAVEWTIDGQLPKR